MTIKQKTAPKIEVELSTPSQRKSAFSVRWALGQMNELPKSGPVLDFGSGRFRNFAPISERFKEITCVETAANVEKFRNNSPLRKRDRFLVFEDFCADERQYVAAFCVSCLHIVPDLAGRRSILERIATALVPGGLLLVDIPNNETYYKRKANNGELESHNDGWLIPHGATKKSFYKNYLAVEFDQLWKETNQYDFVAKRPYSKHIIRLLEKKVSGWGES